MKNILSILFCVFFSFVMNAQEEVLSFKVDKGSKKIKDGYTFSNQETGDLVVLLIERKKVSAYLFDSSFQKITDFQSEPLRTKYNNIIGYSISGNTYTIIGTNKMKSTYAAQTFNFDTKQSSLEEIDFDLGEEKFYETVQYENGLFLITANKENDLILRQLNASNKFSLLKRFLIPIEGREQKLLKGGFFNANRYNKDYANVVKIDNRVPTSIEQTVEPNKLYQDHNKIYITLENSEDLHTTLHVLDVKELELVTEKYTYPQGKKSDFKKFNSFIIDQKIMQLGSSREEMSILIQNFNGEQVNDFYIDVDEPIKIKNSPIIQEGETAFSSSNYREMEETRKFLRKITSSDIGATGYRDGDIFSFVIGGNKEGTSGGSSYSSMGAGGIFIVGVAAVFSPSYNSTFVSYNSYASSKSTYFKTAFDQYFNYVEAIPEDTIFERLKEFKSQVENEVADDVFFHQGILYYSYFYPRTKEYVILKI